jgi:formate/nitrite transporter
MDYVKPAAVAQAMVDAGKAKLGLAPRDLFIRGMLSGAILGVATSLAITAAVTTGQPIVGALIFPVGLVSIVVLGLELLTGSFALLPLPFIEGRANLREVLINLSWVLLGNLVGSVLYGFLDAIALTNMWSIAPAGVAATIVKVAGFGAAGWTTALVKAILCNWMVCLAVVMAMSTTSTVGKIVTAWLPIFIFFAQGFEHTVVNMFIIPTGMMLGAKVTISGWIMWNLIPVTLGNFVGGFFFTGLAIYITHKPKTQATAGAVAATAPAE